MSGHEHEFESSPGLPAPLPPGERTLWSGSPDFRATALRVFHVRKVALYFAALLAWRGLAAAYDGATASAALSAALFLLPFALFACGLLLVLAWLTARLAVYTITDRRVVLRLGIVLTVTFNVPFARIDTAGVRVDRDGTADLPIALVPGDHIAWLHLWPHVRPWQFAHPQPMLRCVPDGAQVARLLADALAAAGAGTRSAPAPAPTRDDDRALPAAA